MTPVKWVYSFLEKYRYKMAAGLLMVTGIALLTIVNPYISGRIVDDVITGGNYKLLPVLIGCLLGVVALKGILRYASQVMFEICSQGVLYSMRDAVYRKLLQEDFSFYNKNRTGDLMSRQTGDMDAIRHFIAYIIYSVYENILLLSFALIMIFTVNVKLALAMLVVLPFTALTTYGQSKSVRPAFMKIRQQFSSLNTFVQENISGNRVVKAFAREDFEIEKFNKENDAYRDAELNAAAIWKKYVPIFEFLSNILTVVLMLYGGYMVIQGEIPMINSFNLFRREADTSFGWNLILVNDDYCVPRNYEVELTELSNGEKVDSRIYPQLQQMFDDARAEELELFVREGYRTTQDQKDIMNERIQQYQNEGYSRGEAKKLAKEYVAEPGTSEHELGIAVDINADTSKCSSDAVYTWLANNAYKYGFIKRYPDNKIEITGVNNEPWHYRYVGVDAALEMQEKGLCLEEYIETLK